MARLISNQDVWAIDYDRDVFPIGRLRNDTLILDSPSRIRSQSYGLDDLVLTSNEMDYHFISLKHGSQEWITTRTFWYDHGKIWDLNNGRVERFLIDELFGKDRAVLYDRYLDPAVQKLIKCDVFAIAKQISDWDNELFRQWEEAIAIEEAYKQSLHYRRKITI